MPPTRRRAGQNIHIEMLKLAKAKQAGWRNLFRSLGRAGKPPAWMLDVGCWMLAVGGASVFVLAATFGRRGTIMRLRPTPPFKFIKRREFFAAAAASGPLGADS